MGRNSMKKASFILAILLSLFLICPAFAQARASDYLAYTVVDIVPGNNQGELNLSFSVRSMSTVSKLGIQKIKIYRSDGSYVTTITGSVSNGLLSPKNSAFYANNYSYKGTPGVFYYAVVTVCAGPSTNYDTKTVKTSVVQAPK